MFFIGPVRRKQTNLDRKVWYTVYIYILLATITSYVNISISCRLPQTNYCCFTFLGSNFQSIYCHFFFFLAQVEESVQVSEIREQCLIEQGLFSAV